MFLLERDDAGTLVHSASDLVIAGECEFRLLRRLDELLGRSPRRPREEDEMLARTAALGEDHERRVLDGHLRAHGPADAGRAGGVLEVAPARRMSRDELIDAHARTLAAMEQGADVVYQASFFDGRFHGRADFLVRDPLGEMVHAGVPGGIVPRYAVHDSKLARRTKVRALIQLAAYADQLMDARIDPTDEVHLVLGTGETTSHRLADLLPVFRKRRTRLLEILDTHVADGAPVSWGDDRYLACGKLRNCPDCADAAAQSRDVLLVGGVYGAQRVKLSAAGITTIDALATADEPPDGMAAGRFEGLRAQARLQLGLDDGDGSVALDHLPDGVDPDGPDARLRWQLTATGAIDRLPPPSPGDVFFDFEGDPLWEEARLPGDDQAPAMGLDYLFGWVERPGPDDGTPPFYGLWADDMEGERDALVRFVDYLNARLVTYPDLHVYHYAAYEKTHLLSIAARHGVYEDEVDQLLRDGVLVDLYAVVRSCLRISNRSKSIKKLEPLYMQDDPAREGVTSATASVTEYAEYAKLAAEGEDGAAPLKQRILDYNEYDCRSTLRLLDWLRFARSSASSASLVEPVETAAVGADVGSENARADAFTGPKGPSTSGTDTSARAFSLPTASAADSPLAGGSPGSGESAHEGAGGGLHGGAVSRGVPGDGAAAPGEVDEAESPRGVARREGRARRLELAGEISARVGENRGERSLEVQALALLGAAVGYYQREEKPFWLEHYARLELPLDEWPGRRSTFHVERSTVLRDWSVVGRDRLPSREIELVGRMLDGSRIDGSDLGVGDAVHVLYDQPVPPVVGELEARAVRGEHSGGVIQGASEPDGERDDVPHGHDVVILRERLSGGAEPHDQVPVALAPQRGPAHDAQEQAVEEAARAALASWDANRALPDGAAVDLLRRRPPRLIDPSTNAGQRPSASPGQGAWTGAGQGGGALPELGSSDGDGGLDLESAVHAAVERLDHSYLAVQGPPGTGKTHVGSHVIAKLVGAGWRVGVVAQSHAAVENMLSAVVDKAGVPAELVAKKQRAKGTEQGGGMPWRELSSTQLADCAANSTEGCVVGGTAWDFAHERWPDGGLDLLVIDEAGQFSLADTIAVGRAAQRLLLLGDPQQLPQVSQGRHPEPVDESALAWLAAGSSVLPDGLGYLLPESWRMHPAVCSAVSELAYAGRLSAHPVTTARSLDGVEPGVVHVPVTHEGHSTSSPEEAAEVVRQVQGVIGRTWVPGGGRPPRPLGPDDVVVVAAYNAQVHLVRQALRAAGLGGVPVGTVDMFQGREAPVAILTLAASTPENVSRGMGFLLSRNRINVAVSRAQWRAVVISSPRLTDYLPGDLEADGVRHLMELGGFLRLTGA
ncbi:TM0106 family RecB-like putative nuclease [Promicromonospora sp. NPDC057138]|uniref:TM0106 family RecB-like putative nuclease n=1 Tax=Promicromonospora sp. NPDC057138 TaxID=3346031 RepID=UPI00363B3E9D